MPAPAQPAPALPPGVRLEPLPAPGRLPAKYHVEMIAVDWTHPLLRPRLLSGLPAGRPDPLTWGEVERERPDGLRLQLSEPLQAGGAHGAWSLALPLAGAPLTGRPAFAITPLCPWLPCGPPLAAEPEWISPLDATGAAVAVRWLGRLEDLDAITTMTFPERCLISLTRPETGRTRFALVVQESGGPIPVADLRAWLAAAAGPDEWLAFHASGPDAVVGTAAWRLSAPARPRRAERLGGALELSGAAPGDLVDWARLPGASASASSFEDGYEPAALIQGRLWPSPFAPRVWISRPAAGRPTETAAPWVQVDLGAFRPVERLVLVWPVAAGWSAQFQPRRVTLKVSREQHPALETIQVIEAPAGFRFEYRFKAATQIRQVRVEMTDPSAMPLDRRARLAGIQLWGPWDGRTQP